MTYCGHGIKTCLRSHDIPLKRRTDAWQLSVSIVHLFIIIRVSMRRGTWSAVSMTQHVAARLDHLANRAINRRAHQPRNNEIKNNLGNVLNSDSLIPRPAMSTARSTAPIHVQMEMLDDIIL
jgi:hypothetical protein